MPARCTTLSDCLAHDGEHIAVVGTYRFHPDLPGIDYSGAPRAVRIELEDGLGPFLDPFWSRRAIRSPAEIERHLGRRVRVLGRFHAVMPRNPADPEMASAMGGPCIEVMSLDAAEA